MSVNLSRYLTQCAVADGAWATLFLEEGAAPGELVELWNLTHPHAVQRIADAYVQAGAEIILTNTFRANRFMVARNESERTVAEINEAGARLSQQAARGRAAVFGSLGPSGKMLAAGNATIDELFDAFGEQAAALAAGGADGIVCETFYDLDEAATAVRAAKETTGLPVVACMTFDSGPDKLHTMMGVSPQQAAETLTSAGAEAVGCNCGAGIDAYIEVVRRMRPHTARPVWAKPNAGLPSVEGETVIYSQTPESFAARVPDLIAAGANIIGGCCGTTPAFIQAVAAAVHR